MATPVIIPNQIFSIKQSRIVIGTHSNNEVNADTCFGDRFLVDNIFLLFIEAVNISMIIGNGYCTFITNI
jgi:hypothetical protein